MMKLQIFAVLAIVVASKPVERRQIAPKSFLDAVKGMTIPKITASRVQQLAPSFPGGDVKRLKLTYGPFKLKAANSSVEEGNFFSLDPQGTSFIHQPVDFPTDVTILDKEFSIHFADGTLINNSNGVYNHHAFLNDATRQDQAQIGCTGTTVNISSTSAIYGSSAESEGEIRPAAVTSRPTTGTYVGKDHVLWLRADLVNYNKRPEEVYISTDLTYVDGKAKGIFETFVYLVPVGICVTADHTPLEPPPGAQRWTLMDDRIEMLGNGKFVSLRGHLHDGSVNLHIKLNGKSICNSRTEYKAAAVGATGAAGGHSHGGHGDSMMSSTTTCTQPIDYKKGDKLSLEANYDLDRHPLRVQPAGGMAETMAQGVFVLAKEL